MTALMMMVAFVAHLAHLASALTAQLAHIDLGDTAAWGLLAGVITPLLTSLVQRPNWSSRKRTFWGVVVSAVIGVLTCLADGTLDHATTVLATVAAVVVVSAATYKALWKPSGVTDSIENATSPQHAKTL